MRFCQQQWYFANNNQWCSNLDYFFSRLWFRWILFKFHDNNSTNLMKKASSGYNTTLKMNEKEKLGGCKRSMIWYHVFQDIWFHFNNIVYKNINIREYIKLTVFREFLSTSHNVDFSCNHDGRLGCWCQGNQTSPLR